MNNSNKTRRIAGKSRSTGGQQSGKRSSKLERRLLLTSAAGFEHIVADAAQADIGGLRVIRVSSGILEAATEPTVSTDQLLGLEYLSAVHQLIVSVKRTTGDVNRLVVQLAEKLSRQNTERPLRRDSSFRLRIIREGTPVAIDRSARTQLERALHSWSGMRCEPRGGGMEVWVSMRRESDEAVLSLRLDRPSRRRAPKGALKPDVAAALVRAAPVGPNDVVIDPFAGSGAIVVARAAYASQRIVASDSDKSAIVSLNRYLASRNLDAVGEAHCCDVRHVVPDLLPAQTATHIITDLPWGKYDQADDLGGLYNDAAESFAALLQVEGWLVCLVHVDTSITTHLLQHGIEVISETNVLISGKKALVVVGRSGPQTHSRI